MIIMQLVHFTVGALGVNCYLYFCEVTKEAAVIDPGDNGKRILQKIAELQLDVKYIINTHGHADHIGANNAIKQACNAKILIHGADASCLTDPKRNLSAFMGEAVLSDSADRILKNGDTIHIGEGSLTVLHTPGNTQGGICLLADTLLFSGDTLFAGSVGRCDFPGGSMTDLIKSVKEKLMVLSDDIIVYPGHGEKTSIGTERHINPYL